MTIIPIRTKVSQDAAAFPVYSAAGTAAIDASTIPAFTSYATVPPQVKIVLVVYGMDANSGATFNVDATIPGQSDFNAGDYVTHAAASVIGEISASSPAGDVTGANKAGGANGFRVSPRYFSWKTADLPNIPWGQAGMQIRVALALINTGLVPADTTNYVTYEAWFEY